MSNEKTEITADRLVQLLEEIVSERPDYVYSAPANDACDIEGQTCVYVDAITEPGKLTPSCGVGHVLHRAGVDLKQLHEGWEMQAASMVVDNLLTVADGDEYSVVQAFEILDWFQAQQDDKVRWEKSLESALREFGYLPGKFGKVGWE